MSKIICDVCGTTYPDSANQCPICGCVRPANVTPVENTSDESGSSCRENYTYIKGGRFSKKNVKKRNRRILRENQQQDAVDLSDENEEKYNDGKGLVIAIIVLLIAVIAVASYITIRFFVPFGEQGNQDITPPDTTVTTTETQVEETTVETTAETTVSTDLILDKNEVVLEQKGAEHTLTVTVNPEDTTDVVVYNSENDAIATVSYDGKITAMGAGETTITVTCGEVSAQCKVICKFDDEATNSEFKAPYRLNKDDVSISVGEKFTLKFMDANDNLVPVVYEIQKPDVCTMDGNKVSGAAKGTTKISVTYNGETYSCIVRVY